MLRCLLVESMPRKMKKNKIGRIENSKSHDILQTAHEHTVTLQSEAHDGLSRIQFSVISSFTHLTINCNRYTNFGFRICITPWLLFGIRLEGSNKWLIFGITLEGNKTLALC